MNETYFRDRLDRYVVLNNAGNLVTYMGEIFNQLASIYDSMDASGVFHHPSRNNRFSLPHFQKEFQIENLDSDSVFIVPSLQLGKHNIFQDSTLLEQLLTEQESLIQKDSRVLFCTSYFNPKSSLLGQILRSRAEWNILTSGPLANSFHGAKGVIGMVPLIYQQKLQSFAEHSRKRNANVKCFEFIRSGLTFHAKGTEIVCYLAFLYCFRLHL